MFRRQTTLSPSTDLSKNAVFYWKRQDVTINKIRIDPTTRMRGP